MLFVTVGFGAVGFFDDYRKLTKRSSKGIPGRLRLLIEFAIALAGAIAVILLMHRPLGTSLTRAVPQDRAVPISAGSSPCSRPWSITGAANAVNLTDGLDGLAIVPTMIAAGCFALIAYLVGNLVFANYLQLQHVTGAGELAVFCAAMVGAALGFLWFNAPPAMVFMGDTGSLSIGGALGVVAVVDQERDRAGDRRRAVRGRDRVGDRAGGRVSSSPASACSAWRRSTTTSRRRAGRSRPSSSASGSSP